MPFDGVEILETTERLLVGRARIEAGWCQKVERRSITWASIGRRVEYCLIGALRWHARRRSLDQGPATRFLYPEQG